ncbi:hypothetical protein [Ralstonia solanacearum]|uniref:hypothetical protein n=1 Tax=Ralstonia solanacearum TaxID=305 RepID=UPI000F608A8D|nr:hypothetical protein [Ralstonia solanacearum]MCL9845118.1 hypothetical protein [Ralstonia solanacearum]MDC6253502.1 hypothetical protein [Ralstonia solanacearum]MDC6258080.1 hypothetical protein [Ralstonia solanacearum]MDC6302521.1 hypothetical protein [Ralstonia solanacearum]
MKIFLKNIGDSKGARRFALGLGAAFVIEGFKSLRSSNVVGHSRSSADDLTLLSEVFIRAMHDSPAADVLLDEYLFCID